MACYSPLQGYYSRTVNASGKRSLVFLKHLAVADGHPGTEVTVPCGKCIGCRLEYSRQWAIRCMHESSLHDSNCFITLTYRDSKLPRGGTLVKSHFQKFMKKFRQFLFRSKRDYYIDIGMSPDAAVDLAKHTCTKIRYFMCGEYGEKLGRPHYHALIFGFDFPDRELLPESDSGAKLYRSAILTKLWGKGICSVGDVTFKSAAYVARYVTKKITGPSADDHYVRIDESTGEYYRVIPEYTTMSRRPGIARAWFDKYRHDVFPRDSVIVNNKAVTPPKSYFTSLELLDPDLHAEVKAKRRVNALKFKVSPERLAELKAFINKKLSHFVRPLS